MRSAIYRWMEKKDSEGPRWTDPSFSGYRDLPEEIRFLLSSDKLEFEIQNGGLPQFLWNTFYHWRWILGDCEAGYKMIGGDPQSLAIPEFRNVLEAHENECRRKIFECVSTKDFRKFNDWMVTASPTLRSDRERFFYSDSSLEKLKEQWYTANRARVGALLN